MKLSTKIIPLNMNGLNGRMMTIKSLPQNNNQEILLLGGHHTSIERMQGYAELFSSYGNITMPDLPGFGGMQSFYHINQKPTFEAYADYLASFIKLRYKRKKVVICAMSISVPMVVLMLQKYPEISKKVSYFVSLVGFVHNEDFKLSKRIRPIIKMLLVLSSTWIVSKIIQIFFLRKYFITLLYRSVASKHGKLKDANHDELKMRINMEIKLWKINDTRTRAYTLTQLFDLDLCHKQVKILAKQINTSKDLYINDQITNQHMQIIFSQFKEYKINSEVHAPAVNATKDDINLLISEKYLKKIFAPI